jgi:heterodisulfide reductase subunit C
MASVSGPTNPSGDFLAEVETAFGQSISSCFHCGKCSSGCPVTFAMDLLPNQVLRLVQLGCKEQALGSSTIWLCASCQTCTTRCPNEVDIAGLMDVLRQQAVRDGVAVAEEDVVAFHDAFLGSVAKRGRVFEAGMLAEFRLRTRDHRPWLEDAELGWEMFRRGKLRLLPESIRGQQDIKEIFRRSED